MKLEIKYNSQRDNPPRQNIQPWAQCGYTSASMLLSAWIKKAQTDDYVLWLIDELEASVGGLRKYVTSKLPWVKGRIGSYGDAYAAAIGKILESEGINRKVRFAAEGGSFTEIYNALDVEKSPVFLATKITDSGHFILIVGYDAKRRIVICHDPYGDANTGYKKTNGAYVEYPADWLEAKAKAASKTGLRYIYARKVK